MKATNQFSTIYVQNWTLMRFVAFMVDITKCPPSTDPHLNTNNTVKQKDVFIWIIQLYRLVLKFIE